MRPDQTAEAVAAVSGRWWSNGRLLKQQVDVSLDSGTVTPRLVPNLPFGTNRKPRRFLVPSVKLIKDRDCSGFCSIRIEPRCAAADLMRVTLPGRPKLLEVDKDLPVVMESMQRQMTVQFDEAVSIPLPSATAT